jgi:hypothetical protein
VVSRAHSAQLAGASGAIGTFSDPVDFDANIVWQNRQFFFWVDSTSGCTPGDPGCTSTYGLCPDLGPAPGLACPGGNTVVYDDLAVIGTAGSLTGTDNLLTGVGPLFVAEYFNGARGAIAQPEINAGIQTPAAFDEGGNFIRPAYGPLSLYLDAAQNNGDPGSLFGDYHILSNSLAHNAANLGLTYDFDLEPRPVGAYDIGADEIQ